MTSTTSSVTITLTASLNLSGRDSTSSECERTLEDALSLLGTNKTLTRASAAQLCETSSDDDIYRQLLPHDDTNTMWTSRTATNYFYLSIVIVMYSACFRLEKKKKLEYFIEVI